MKIGAQFYTIRDFCRTPEDLYESIKKVADIGYSCIQLSGVCDYDAAVMDKWLKEIGVDCVLTHIAPTKLTDNTEKVIAEHDAFGCDLIGLGSFPFYEEGGETRVSEFIDAYLPVAKALKDGGKYFMYHNHDAEFKKFEDRLVIDLMAEKMPAELMGFTLDTYWVQKGGADPAYWLEKLSGRVPAIHLKDYSYGAKMEPIGKGNINFDRVFEKAEAAGTKYMLVEQDNCNGMDPFECLKISYDYLRSAGF